MKQEVALGNGMVDCDDEQKFDFQVDDILMMVKKAESLGAIKANDQFGGDEFITMFDPAGHPFCLCHK